MKNNLLLMLIFILFIWSCKKTNTNTPNYLSNIVGVYRIKEIDSLFDSLGNRSYIYDSGLMAINFYNTTITRGFYSESYLLNLEPAQYGYRDLNLVSIDTVNKTLGFGGTRIKPGLGRIGDTLIFNYETNIINEYEYNPNNNPYFIQITGTKI